MDDFKKISISALKMEMPALGTDAEGKLKGGFSVATFSEGFTIIQNGNCSCNVAKECPLPALPSCGDVKYDNGNCTCGTQKPTTTTGSTAGAGQNFSMNLSLLF